MNMDLKRLRPWAWPAGIGLLVAAGLAFSFWPRAVAVDVAEVARAPMMTAISDDGITRVREVYVLSAPIAGKLLRVESHAGDFIAARKTVVATIEPTDPAFLDARAQRQLAFTVSAARAARAAGARGFRRAQDDLQGRVARHPPWSFCFLLLHFHHAGQSRTSSEPRPASRAPPAALWRLVFAPASPLLLLPCLSSTRALL
jgi:multidrug efflux pump subunit AcrA (membrane-fusion protein)